MRAGPRPWRATVKAAVCVACALLSGAAFASGQFAAQEPLASNLAVHVSTAAGDASYGRADGAAMGMAQFDTPSAVASSPDGSFLLVSDYLTSLVRHINLTSKTVTTLAGGETGNFADGVGSLALFQRPLGLAVSPDGTWVAVADSANDKIRRIDVATRAVTTLSGSSKGFNDGDAGQSRFNVPSDLAFDPTGSYLLVADSGNSAIRKVSVGTGSSETVAGQGPGTAGMADGLKNVSKVQDPRGIAMSPDGAWAAVVDNTFHAVLRLDTTTWALSTIAGGKIVRGKPLPDYINGIGTAARFDSPRGVCISPVGHLMLVADTNNNVIRAVDLSNMNVSTLAGSGTRGQVDSTTPPDAAFDEPVACSFGPGGAWAAIADKRSHVIRNISAHYPTAPTPAPDPYSDFSQVVNLDVTSAAGRLPARCGDWCAWRLAGTLAVAALPTSMVMMSL